MYKDFSGAFVYVPTMLPFARQAIASLELDVLVYLDLGMDPFTFLLAFARLARVQAVLSGHPDTTGIDTVDCFLSPAILEGEQAETHYTEQLVRLQSAKFSFPKPDVPKPLKSRAELGLPTSGRIYFCPMMLQKIHPDFDQTIASILSLDLEAHVILCDSFQHPRWSVLLRERLAKIIPSAHLKRLTFIPWIHDTGDFLAAIAASDVILDPFHFGIGTTGAYCFSVGTPIVTWPGEFMRGRAGLAYCEELDLMDCVAACQEEYASLAVRIASDKALHASIKDRILANNHRLFGENSVANEIAEFFLSRVNSLGPATESAGQ